QDEKDRNLHVLDEIENVTIALAELLRDIEHETKHVDVANGLERHIDHPHVHAMQRTVDARGVEKYDLCVRIIADAENPGSRRLRFHRNDREFGANQAIEERRFAGIRPADERHESTFHGTASCAGSSSTNRRVIRTLLTLRRSTSSTSMCKPSTSICSPI